MLFKLNYKRISLKNTSIKSKFMLILMTLYIVLMSIRFESISCEFNLL